MGFLPSRGSPKRHSIALAAVLILCASGGGGVAQESRGAPTAVSAAQARPAGGALRRAGTVFTVERFGRYAVGPVSLKGASLRLIDRMAGPGDEDGAPGGRDGRIDLFLGPGEHKAEISFAAGEPKPPELAVRPFQELNQGTPPQLVELALVETELGDLQQRSYWLDIPKRQTVFLEAAGRHLKDLRLWKDGTWLVDAVPAESRSERDTGQPLAVRQLTADLAPGLYLLTAYGGPGEVWSKSGNGDPLVLRWGIPALPEAGRRQFEVGPFGFDRWLVAGSASYFRLEVPRGGVGGLDVASFRDGAALRDGSAHAAIDRAARYPIAELRRAQESGGGAHLVTVRRPVGASYVLQHYATMSDTPLTVPADGDYLLSTLRPGRGGDDVDLTAVLSEITGGTGKVERRETIVARQTIKLGPEAGWRRRFNLSDPLSLFVEVTKSGRYAVAATGLDVEVQLSAFSLSGAGGLQLPPRAGGGVWDLDAGIYELRVAPRLEGRGVLGLSLHAEGAPEAAEPAAPVLGVSFGPLKLLRTARYRLRLNEAPGAGFGAALRRLPADAADDLPLALAPGERRALPVSLAAAGTLQALGDDNAVLPLSVDGASAVDKAAAGAGKHSVEVANPGTQPLIVSLHHAPAVRPPAVVLPPISADTLRKLPDFPVLEAGRPRFLDLGVRQEATFAVKVGGPALYRVETTGLLQTAGTLRTRVQPALARASANGVGRNLLLQQYLREGLYQLTIGTEGATTGHLGLVMTASAMRDGGALTPGVPARASLGVGEGVSYGFDVAEAGRYHLRALSLNGAAVIRLEDAEGWPLTRPDQAGDLARDLDPGHYRLVVLPHPLPGRLLTLVEAERAPPPLAGHGPHPLPLDGAAANRWEEPADGGPRRPDVWSFDLAAEADLALTLGEPMEGEIRRDGEERAVAALSFRQPWRGRLGAGSYHLDVRSVRPNNRLDYTVTAAVEQLTAGRSRAVTAPARIPVALGDGQRVEISSFGAGEVRAVLLAADGAEVARSDERPGDWNFVITTRPAPGQYVLKVEPMAGKPVQTTVRVQALAEVAEAPLAAPGDRAMADGLLHVVPLDLKPGDGPLLVAAVRSEEAAGLVLERRGADGVWRSAASASGRSAVLALPRDVARREDYRLQVWSMDHARIAVSLAVRAVAPAAVSESALAAGIGTVAVPGLEPPLGVAEVRLERPGLFRLAAPNPGLIWSATAGRGLAKGSEPVVAGGSSLWFLQPSAAGRIQAGRITPEAGTPLALTLPEGGGAVVPVSPEAAGPRLWVADSRVGQPGLTVGPRNGGSDGRASGLAAGAAATVLPGAVLSGAGLAGAGEPVLRLWRADGTGELPLTLRPFGFGAPERGGLEWGESDRALAAGAALELALPTGPKRLRLALPAHAAAALLRGGAVERVVWSEAGVSATLDSGAERLLLLNAGKGEGRLSLLLTPAGESAEGLRLARGVMLRRSLPTAGTLLVDVEPGEADRGRGLVLRLSGPVDEAILMQRDGAVRSGAAALAVDEPGLLLLRHRPGAIVGWLGNGDERDWLERAAKSPPQPVPATLALSGAETAWRFVSSEPALLHLASAVPVLAGVLRAGAAPDLAVWPQGANLHLFLPAGQDAVVGLRPLQAGALSGSARLARGAAVPVGEGAGPKLRLAPGDARLFVFDLKEAGAVGVGVRGDADSARLRLFDPAGRMLAEGAVAMRELTAGRYFLLVENRSDAAATDVQPVLAGVARPGREPPEEVRRHYWALVTGQEDEPNDDN